jgi:periplasmic copper chaperone A
MLDWGGPSKRSGSGKMKLYRLMGSTALALLATVALAHDYMAGSIAIGHPYARATVSGQPAGGGYMKLENKGDADRLLSVSADVAASVELHEMKMDGDVMRMRQVDAIVLPAGKTVELAPGALHIMFVGLKAPLAAGSSFPMKLKFEKAGEVMVDVKVEAASATTSHHGTKH